jgi:hypothetical protein
MDLSYRVFIKMVCADRLAAAPARNYPPRGWIRNRPIGPLRVMNDKAQTEHNRSASQIDAPEPQRDRRDDNRS